MEEQHSKPELDSREALKRIAHGLWAWHRKNRKSDSDCVVRDVALSILRKVSEAERADRKR